MPSGDPQDPGYRRLRYCRYADDTLLGFAGPKAEAEEIKPRLAQFLRDDLKLELSQDKTLITHARTRRAPGSSATRSPSSTANQKVSGGRRSVNGVVALRVPPERDQGQVRPIPTARTNPRHGPRWSTTMTTTIISTYGAEYRGLVQVLPAGR